jgi:putative transposase
VVTARQGREAVKFVQAEFKLSQRHACELVGLHRSTCRLVSRRKPEEAVRERLRALAQERVRFGYRRLHALLAREGLVVNHKRTYRLYREEGLAIRRKKSKRLRSEYRGNPQPATRPNERWEMDFVEDALSNGRKLRALTMVDAFTRECPHIEVDTSLPSLRVIRVLNQLAEVRGLPAIIRVDNGPEFFSKALDAWAVAHGVQLDFARPGKPTDKAHIESFNGRLRDECLNQSYFISVADARMKIDAWRRDYNEVRPHSALQGLTPAGYMEQVTGARQPEASETPATCAEPWQINNLADVT